MPTLPPLSPLFATSLPEESSGGSHDIQDETSNLSLHMEHLGLTEEPIFLGEASGVRVTHQVLGMRSEAHNGSHTTSHVTNLRPQYWQKLPVRTRPRLYIRIIYEIFLVVGARARIDCESQGRLLLSTGRSLGYSC